MEVPTLDFATQEAASGLLETVATTTVAVAGLAFSVTVVAFTLTAQQLSPRVLRSFRADRLRQLAPALFLGTFVLALTVLVRLGVREDDGVPGLSITAVVLLAFLSFGLFAVFVGHIARMLQPSSVIAAILGEAKGELGGRYPQGVGADPEDKEAAIPIRIAHMSPTSPIRVDADGKPRFLARPPDLDQLIRLGFNQVRVFAAADPAATATVVELLQRIKRAGGAAGAPCAEAEPDPGSGGASR